jgi:hypothetical protein
MNLVICLTCFFTILNALFCFNSIAGIIGFSFIELFILAGSIVATVLNGGEVDE